MTVVNTINYDSASGFSFDADFVSFTGGVASLKDTRPPNAMAYASYGTAIDFDWDSSGEVNVAPTTSTNATITSNKLSLTGVGVVTWPSILAGRWTATNQFTIQFRLTAHYTGNPTAMPLLDISKEGASGTNRVLIQHQSSQLRVIITSSTGSTLLDHFFGAFSAVSGQEYEIVLRVDTTGTNPTQMYLDGTQLGSNQTVSGTRTADVGKVRHGNGLGVADFSVRNLLFSAGWGTEVPPATLQPTVYGTGNYAITPASGIQADGLSELSDTSVANSGQVKYAVSVDGVAKYWDGATWSNSNLTTQTNTAAEVTTNASALDISSGANIKVVPVLTGDSEGFDSPPTLSQTVLCYDFAFPTVTEPNKVLTYWRIRDLVGGNVSNASLKVTNEDAYVQAGFLVGASTKTFQFDASGLVEATLYETATAATKYKFEVTYTQDGATYKSVNLGVAEVPNLPTVDGTSLTFSDGVLA